VVAAVEQAEDPGNDQYQTTHMDAIFKEGFSFSGFERDHVSLNLGSKEFLDISGVSGLDSISDGRGSVFADLDNDGDTDVLLTTVQREAHYLFRNNVGTANNFLRVEVEGNASGRDAFGAVVRVGTSQGTLSKIKSGGSGFLSQNDPRLLFGLGSDTSAEWVEITWPSGKRQRFADLPANTALKLIEGHDEPLAVAENRFTLVDPLSPSEAMLARLGLAAEKPFPDLSVRSLDQQEHTLAELVQPGKRYLINFWATYCVPCAQEMPELQALRDSLSDAGVEVLGLSIDLDTADQIPEYLASYGIGYPIYTVSEEAVSEVFPRGEVLIPISFLVDERLAVLDVFSGWSAESRRAVHALTTDTRSGG
jgi:thiol-disulfide isomerase/thioredoxin